MTFIFHIKIRLTALLSFKSRQIHFIGVYPGQKKWLLNSHSEWLFILTYEWSFSSHSVVNHIDLWMTTEWPFIGQYDWLLNDYWMTIHRSIWITIQNDYSVVIFFDLGIRTPTIMAPIALWDFDWLPSHALINVVWTWDLYSLCLCTWYIWKSQQHVCRSAHSAL